MGKDLGRPRGRPSLSDHDRKNKTLKIRLKDHQFQDLQTASEKLKVSVSEFVRKLALSEAKLLNGEEELLRKSQETDDDSRFCVVVNHSSHRFFLYRCLEINRKFGVAPCLLFDIKDERDTEAYDITCNIVKKWELPIKVSQLTESAK